MIHDRLADRSPRGRRRERGAGGDVARPHPGPPPGTEPAEEDFTGTLRTLFARGLASDDSNSARIRERLRAAGVPVARTTPTTASTSIAPGGAGVPGAGGSTLADTDTDTDTDEPISGGPGVRTLRRPPGHGAGSTAPGRSTRPRRSRHWRHPRAVLLGGAGATAIAGVLLINGTLTGGNPDPGSVSAPPHLASSGSASTPSASGQAKNTDPLPPGDPTTTAPAPPSSPQPAPGGDGPATLGAVDGPAAREGDGAAGPSADTGQRGGSGSGDSQSSGGRWGDGTRGGTSQQEWGRDDGGARTAPDSRDRWRDGSDEREQGQSHTSTDRDGVSGTTTSKASSRAFGTRERVHLPMVGCLDWVLFNAGGVQTRAASPLKPLGTSQIGPGRDAGGFASSFSWMGGRPIASGAGDDDRLATTRARLDVHTGTGARRLDIYLGASSSGVEVVVGSGRGAQTHRVALPGRSPGGADAVLTVWLSRGEGFTGVTVSASGGGTLALAAAVLY